MATFPSTWVLVADSARARFFSWTNLDGPLEEIDDQANPEGRLKDSELGADKAGVTFSSKGHQSSHRMQATTVREAAAEAFARSLADALKQGLDDHRCERLVLVAPPAFLGSLRKHLDKRTAQTVVASIDRELTQASVPEIFEHLPALGSLPEG